MADRDLEIRLKVDRQQAAQAAQAELRDLTRVRDAHRDADREKTQGTRRAAEESVRESRRATEAQVGDVKRLRDERGRFVSQAITDDRRLADNAARSWGQVGGGIGNATAILRGFSAQMLGLDGMRSIIQSLTEDWRRFEEAAAKAGERVTDRRESIRKLAALKGQAGETLRTEQQLLDLRAATFQTREEALGMEFAMVGTGDPFVSGGGVTRRINRDQFDRFKRLTGQLQAMTGVDAAQIGGFAGLMPLMLDKAEGQEATAEEAFTRLAQVNQMLQLSGAEAGVLMEALKGDVSLLTSGAFTSIQEQAAVYGALGTLKGAGTSTSANQLVRATIGSLGRMRGSQIMEGLTDDEIQKRGEYLQGIGATPGMTTLQVADLVAADIDARSERARATGEAFDVRTYLQSQGYGGNIQDVDALLSYRSIQRELRQTYLPIAERDLSLDEAMAPVRRFQQSDPLAARRRADVAAEAGDILAGAGGPELVEQLRRQAFERMRASGEASGTFEEFTGAALMGRSRLATIDARVAFGLNQQLPAELRDFGLGQGLDVFDARGRAERLAAMAAGVQARGGDLGDAGRGLGDAAAVVDRLDRQLELQQRREQRDLSRMPPPPPILRPPAPANAGGPIR